MLRKITINMLTMTLLMLNCQTLSAQTGYDSIRTDVITDYSKPHHSPITRLQRLIRDMEIYEYLLGNTHFIKLQDMVQRVWDKQTGKQRRVVTYSRHNITLPQEQRVRSPYR